MGIQLVGITRRRPKRSQPGLYVDESGLHVVDDNGTQAVGGTVTQGPAGPRALCFIQKT